MTSLPDADRPTVLVVDDSPEILALIHELLKDRHRVKIATSGDKALRIAAAVPQPDLILLDVLMPDMDGYELCRWLKTDAHTRDIPVMFLTARSDVADESHGLALGAVDYITKPISPPILMARVRNQLQLKAGADFLRDKAAYLEAEVLRRTAELTAVQDAIILALAALADARDAEAPHRVRRTRPCLTALAEALRDEPRFAGTLTDDYLATLHNAAPLHVIGKVGIPDTLRHKRGDLTLEEFAILTAHARRGRDAIVHAQDQLGTTTGFLAMAKDMAYSFQERWDGSGYPEGLKGEEIPLSARLMAVADRYDTLTRPPSRAQALSHDEAVADIGHRAGTDFDPEVVRAFLRIQEDIRAMSTAPGTASP